MRSRSKIFLSLATALATTTGVVSAPVASAFPWDREPVFTFDSYLKDAQDHHDEARTNFAENYFPKEACRGLVSDQNEYIKFLRGAREGGNLPMGLPAWGALTSKKHWEDVAYTLSSVKTKNLDPHNYDHWLDLARVLGQDLIDSSQVVKSGSSVTGRVETNIQGISPKCLTTTGFSAQPTINFNDGKGIYVMKYRGSAIPSNTSTNDQGASTLNVRKALTDAVVDTGSWSGIHEDARVATVNNVGDFTIKPPLDYDNRGEIYLVAGGGYSFSGSHEGYPGNLQLVFFPPKGDNAPKLSNVPGKKDPFGGIIPGVGDGDGSSLPGSSDDSNKDDGLSSQIGGFLPIIGVVAALVLLLPKLMNKDGQGFLSRR